MTDRQIGHLGANADIDTDNQQQLGGHFVQVDYTYPLGVQTGHLGTTVDLLTLNQQRTGGLMVMVDYVPSLIPTTAVRWSGTVFEMGTSSPVVRWAGSAFATSGSAPIVIWNLDHFELAP